MSGFILKADGGLYRMIPAALASLRAS